MMILNPNKEKRKRIGEELLDNKGYCPCLIERNEDTKCRCKAMREKDICICGLFVKALDK